MRGMRMWVCLGVVVFGLATAAPAAGVTVTTFPLESNTIGNLSQGPTGTIYYSGTHPNGSPLHPEAPSSFIGRFGPAGPLADTPIPLTTFGQVAAGSEGNVWFTDGGEPIARLTPAGQWLASGMHPTGSETHITPAAGGGVWFTARDDSRNDIVGRISATGEVSEWPIPTHESGPEEIVEGREGNAWFGELFGDKIGRVTPSGAITEYPLPKNTRPQFLTVDGEGNIWFTGQIISSPVWKLSPSGVLGRYGLPGGVSPGAIAAGPDGRIWFTEAVRHEAADGEDVRTDGIGRIGFNGRWSEVPLPARASDAVEVIAGSESDLWYAAKGERPCAGGGCTEGTVTAGRIAVDPLRTVIGNGSGSVWRNRANVPITCSEGNVTETCEGTVEVKIGGRAVGRSRYVVPNDYTREWPAKRLGRIPSLLELTGKRRRALAIVRPDTGGRVRRKITLTPAG